MDVMKNKIFLLAFTIFSFVLSACKTQYVPYDVWHYDTLYRSLYCTDTLIERDTLREKTIGDTVYLEKIKYVYSGKSKVDTIYQSKTDTITNTVEVEKKLTKSEVFYMTIGEWLFWIILIFFIGFIALKCVKKYMKK